MRPLLVFQLALAFLTIPPAARGEAMLQLFNVNWDELVQKMPEIAEAGYTSLWLPPPAKAGSVFSVGYDLFDPFDLGDKNQRGTVRTRYGTKAQLLQVVETAHRFGLRVYFDNIMNHRGFDVPGYNASTPTNLYPGLSPGDFHLRQQVDGTFRNWDNVSNYGNVWEVQNRPLFGLLDLANEPGSINLNHGATLGSTITKPIFVRQPGSNTYYMDMGLPAIAGPWRPFNGANGDPVPEDVNAYLIRAFIWTLAETKCDGFRLDAVKHTPAGFFGATSATPDGYTGALQTMFDYVHGFGNNVTGNGYLEGDDNRNSCYNTETTRNDALLFGEHLGEPPSFQEYLDRGMRLLNTPYHYQFNNIFGNPSASLSGMDQRDYLPYPSAIPGRFSVLFAQSHDDASSTRRELHNAYNFFREGLPSIYSDGYNQSSGPDFFPRVASAPYLGQFGDNKMPDVAYLHHQLARGGTRSRWSDADIVAFERYDYREVTDAFNNPHATVVLFAMNDNYGFPGDISFDDGVAQNDSGMPATCYPVQNSRGVGLVVGFPPGSWLTQHADSPGDNRACGRLLVRQATQSLAEAQSTANDPNPVNRKVYVGGQSLAPGGGAIEFKIPSGGYVAYGYQWPEPSRAGNEDAITFRQGGAAAARVTVFRRDGKDGDAGFNPLYPFKMRGSVDPLGNVIGGANVSNKVYAIDVPVLTNAPFDILVRSDASASNALLKLDGGTDLNSHLGLGPTSGLDRRDNRPGFATDVLLGYEQSLFQSRFGPEKFAALFTNFNALVSPEAWTYRYSVFGTGTHLAGSGYGSLYDASAADWVLHNPTNAVAASGGGPGTQRWPYIPVAGEAVELWVKVGYKQQINRCFIYYTTNGTNPEGAFGVGRGNTKVIEADYVAADALDANIDWWRGTIPASNHVNGAEIRYKIALFHDNIAPISDADEAKLFGQARFGVTNFNPTTATVWLHNNLNTNHTVTGLREGFHIVRARTFLPRPAKSSVFNTFLQTFYYDAAPPTGVVAFPPGDGNTLSSSSYTAVIRADASVTAAEVNVQDSDPGNDDTNTGLANGNGMTNGVPVFVNATPVNPDPGISAQHPNLPQEFRYTYAPIPSGGSATITVRLKELTSTVLTNHVTTLTRTVNTLAPANVVRITQPGADGQVFVVATNEFLPLRVCFTSTLTTSDTNLFSLYLNGVFQPRSGFSFAAGGCGAGLRALHYNWTNPPAGSNLVQIVFTNSFALGDTRTVTVVRPGDSDGDGMSDLHELTAGTNPNDPASVLRITDLANGNRLVVWDSVPGVNYQVLATTNPAAPLQVISPIIPASGGSSFYFDNSPDPTNKFYRVQIVP